MPTITFRCTEAEYIELHDRAGGNMTRYLKDLVFGQIDQKNALEAILQRLDSAPGQQAQGSDLDGQTRAIFVEILLLMRGTVKPATKREAQAEVERLGMDVWSSDTYSGSGNYHG